MKDHLAARRPFLTTNTKMPRPDVDQLDEQIERLRGGGTLTENEVKVLCDKVREADREWMR